MNKPDAALGSTRDPKLPESLAQARRFEQFHKAAAYAGLCTTCASQHAYGRQHGFSTVNPPCDACRLLMQAWSVRKPGGWAAIPTKNRAMVDVATPPEPADVRQEDACEAQTCTSQPGQVPEQRQPLGRAFERR